MPGVEYSLRSFFLEGFLLAGCPGLTDHPLGATKQKHPNRLAFWLCSLFRPSTHPVPKGLGSRATQNGCVIYAKKNVKPQEGQWISRVYAVCTVYYKYVILPSSSFSHEAWQAWAVLSRVRASCHLMPERDQASAVCSGWR